MIGVISGLIVTFLFYTPKISLINTIAKNEDDNFYCEFIYENKGQSPAINIEYIIKYAILYKNEIITKSELQKKQGKIEAGDVLACRLGIVWKSRKKERIFLKTVNCLSCVK